MKKEYDLKKLKRRPGTPKSDPEAAKIPISIRLDGSVLSALKTEAERLGIPYQTYIGSVLHRFARFRQPSTQARMHTLPVWSKNLTEGFSGPDVPSIKAVRRPDQKPSSADGIQTILEIG